MQFDAEAYSKHYIVQALFKLMGAYEYDKISVTALQTRREWGAQPFTAISNEKKT